MTMVLYCAHCGQPILPGEAYGTIDKFSSSGAGAILYVHKNWCEPPTETAPARSW